VWCWSLFVGVSLFRNLHTYNVGQEYLGALNTGQTGVNLMGVFSCLMRVTTYYISVVYDLKIFTQKNHL
jgi:hypothetical protein